MTTSGMMWLVTWKHGNGKQSCASWALTRDAAIAGARQLEEDYEAEDLRQMKLKWECEG